MEPIPKGWWKNLGKFAGFSPAKANKEMIKIANSQPYLLAFVVESSKEVGREVSELAIYLFLVVYRMFQGSWEDQKDFFKEIIECYHTNESLMERLEGTHEKFLDRIASLQTSKQPYVVKYVVDALMEEDEGEDALILTEEQKGFLYLLLKTVIDVLDQKDWVNTSRKINGQDKEQVGFSSSMQARHTCRSGEY
jgi:hypothetical protein